MSVDFASLIASVQEAVESDPFAPGTCDGCRNASYDAPMIEGCPSCDEAMVRIESEERVGEEQADLHDLPTVWLPPEPQKRTIVLPNYERIERNEMNGIGWGRSTK